MELAQALEPAHLLTLAKLFKADDALLRADGAVVEGADAVLFRRAVDEHAVADAAAHRGRG